MASMSWGLGAPSVRAVSYTHLDVYKRQAHNNVIAGHAHLSSLGQSDSTGNVGSSDIELRTIVIEERCMTASLVLSKDVNLALELCMRTVSYTHLDVYKRQV